MSGAPLAAVRATMARFVNQAHDQDRVAVLTIADDTRVEVPFGADKATLADRLKSVSSRGTLTRLYDGALFALAQLEGAPPEFRQLTIISDGHDEGSIHSIDEVIKQALQDKIQIDSIGLSRSHPEFLQSLERISKATGGRYAKADSPDELDGLIEQGIRTMRATPVVLFKTEKLAADGKTHNVQVRWEPGSLTASVDVHAPQIADQYLVWAAIAGGCLLLVVVLLIVALKRKRPEPPAPIRLVQEPPPPIQRPPRTEPLVNRPPISEAPEPRPAPPPVRAYTPTVVDEEPPAPPPEPPAPPAPKRSKTRVAAFFHAEEGSHGAVLEAIAGPVAGKSFPITGELLIGALAGNDLVISGDPTLSGFHARVRLADSVLTIEDAHSTNGTHVNGERLGQDRKLLKPGDEIRMGRSVFRVRSG
jgi:hypothetical protein